MAPLRYAAKLDPFLSLEGIKFCHLATLQPDPPPLRLHLLLRRHRPLRAPRRPHPRTQPRPRLLLPLEEVLDQPGLGQQGGNSIAFYVIWVIFGQSFLNKTVASFQALFATSWKS